MGGAESTGKGIGNTVGLVADDVQTVVIPGAGHWIAEQTPEAVLTALTGFLAPYRDGAAARRAAGRSPPPERRRAYRGAHQGVHGRKRADKSTSLRARQRTKERRYDRHGRINSDPPVPDRCSGGAAC
jgi:hypothetical protein